MHRSVFEDEAVSALQVAPGMKYIDATLGEAGHAKIIVSQGGDVLGIDADPTQVKKHDGMTNIIPVCGNFGDIAQIAIEHDFQPVSGILADLGLSMEQLTKSGKGLSYRAYDEPLDMRLSGVGKTAADYLNTTDEDILKEELTKYSEDLAAQDIALEIISFRRKHRLKIVRDLIECTERGLKGRGDKERTYARIFQAIRIIVNNEFEMIQKLLENGMSILKKGGRIVIITFHSLEDRRVKQFAKAHKGQIKHTRVDVDKKRKLQAFERSATLRILEKI